MYNDNDIDNNQELGNGMNPDEHKAAEEITNFVLEDSDNEDSGLNQRAEGQGQQNQPQSSNVYGQQSQPGNVYEQNQVQRINSQEATPYSQPSAQQTQSDNLVQPSQQTQPVQPVQPTPQMQTGQFVLMGQQTQSDNLVPPSQPAQPVQPTPQMQPDQFVQMGQQVQSDNPVQPGQQIQPIQPTQQTQSGQQFQSGQMGQQTQQPQQFGGVYQNNYIPPREKVKKVRKKHGTARKVAGIAAAALLFGVVSGGTIVGINTLADSFKKPAYPQVTQAALAQPPAGDSSDAPQANTPLSMDVSSIVEEAMPSVVAINNTVLYQGSTWFGQSQAYEVPASGSGIIVGQNADELLIVTNNHVVADSTNMSVVFIDNTSVKAAVKGTDAESDLAIIAVPLKDIPETTLSQIAIATLGNSDNLKVGQGVVAIGNAMGYGQSVTVGYVSALNRKVKAEDGVKRDLLQTDAAINPGNSGGALLNMKGEVIGINAAKYASTDVEGIGYAIPISKAEDIIKNLMTKKTRKEVDADNAGSVGIQGQNVSQDMADMLGMPEGIFVYKILDDGAASKTDLHEKDIIVKFDDQSVRTMADLQNMLKYYSKGETVNLTVMSLENGQYTQRVIPITLGAKSQMKVDNN